MAKDQISALLERVRTWPADRQADLAAAIAEMEAQDRFEVGLSEDQLRGIDEAIVAADRGEFATVEEVAALWAKLGL